MNKEQPHCKNPTCRLPVMHTYTDPHGNDLGLCDEHYYDAVIRPHTLRSVRSITKTDKDDKNPFSFLFK